MKQVIVIRKDLNMRKGKMVAQGAHASMVATLEYMDDYRVKEWLDGLFTKICVSVGSEEELKILVLKAHLEGIPNSLILDSGKTEFKGIETYTAGAIGPASNEELDSITGHLKLL